MTIDNFCFHLQNILIQTSQTGGQWYSETSPFSIPWSKVLFSSGNNSKTYFDKIYDGLAATVVDQLTHNRTIKSSNLAPGTGKNGKMMPLLLLNLGHIFNDGLNSLMQLGFSLSN